MAAVFYFPLIGTSTAPGNQLWFYEAGLDVPLDVWTDSDLTIPWAQPIVLNAAGESDGPIYVSPSPAYKVRYEDANGVAIAGYPVDFVSPSTIINVTRSLTTTLTNAQILALPTTPITVVAAPASGLRAKPIAPPSLRINTTAGAYTNVNATYCALTIGWAGEWAAGPLLNDTSPTPDLTQATKFFNVAHNYVADLGVPYVEAMGGSGAQWVFSGAVGEPGQFVSTQSGVALTLSVDNNGSGNFTGGNAANTMAVTVYYVLESVV